jgi:hypothetical protein
MTLLNLTLRTKGLVLRIDYSTCEFWLSHGGDAVDVDLQF